LLRKDGRENEHLRDCTITRSVNKYAEGSCLIQIGDTKVHCTASVEDRVPRWMMDQDGGWVTAEYSMLPRATSERNEREATTGKQGGRTMEIQRLIGRSLRAVVDSRALGQRTIKVDCDVLQADGGTRTASITGGYVALAEACALLKRKNQVKRWPLTDAVAAISVGIVSGEQMLDLSYEEDSRAAVDLNLVMCATGRVIEVQATAEGAPFTVPQLGDLVNVAQRGLLQLFGIQREALADLDK
jgi:ribonuclease PH